MRLTLLGTGAAGGMPRFRCDCRACRIARSDPAQTRRACSARLDADDTTLLLDAGRPDLPAMLAANGDDPAAILLTHYHVDHVQGLFELRWGQGQPIPVIGPDDPNGCADLHRNSGILDFSTPATAFVPFTLGPWRITPVPLIHSKPCLGYVIDQGAERLAYLTDTIDLPAATRDWLAGRAPDLTVIDGTHAPSEPEPRNHNNLDHALAIHGQLGSKHTVLTHVGHTLADWLLDHETELPTDVTVGRDGEAFDTALSD